MSSPSLYSISVLAWDHAIEPAFWTSHSDAVARFQALGSMAGCLCGAISQAHPDLDPMIWHELAKRAHHEGVLDSASRKREFAKRSPGRGPSQLLNEDKRNLVIGFRQAMTSQEQFEAVANAITQRYLFQELQFSSRPWSESESEAVQQWRDGRRVFDDTAGQWLAGAEAWARQARAEFDRLGPLDQRLAIQRAELFFVQGDMCHGPALEAATAAVDACVQCALERSPASQAALAQAVGALAQGLQGDPFTQANTRLECSGAVKRVLLEASKTWIGLVSTEPESASWVLPLLRLALLDNGMDYQSKHWIEKEAWFKAATRQDWSKPACDVFRNQSGAWIQKEWTPYFPYLKCVDDASSFALSQLCLAEHDPLFELDEPGLARALAFVEREDPPSGSQASQRLSECQQRLRDWGESLEASGRAETWARVNQSLRDHGAHAWASEVNPPSREDRIATLAPIEAVIEVLDSGSCPGDPQVNKILAQNLWSARSKISSLLESDELKLVVPNAPPGPKRRI